MPFDHAGIKLKKMSATSNCNGTNDALITAKPNSHRFRYCALLVFLFTFVLFTTDALVSQMYVPKVTGMFKMRVYDNGGKRHDTPVLDTVKKNVSLDSNSKRGDGSAKVTPVTTKQVDPVPHAVDLGPPEKGAEYLLQPPKTVSKEFRQKLKDKYSLEPAEDHAFQSPFINTPEVYPVAKIQQPGDTTIKTKIISIFNCPGWFKGLKGKTSLNKRNRDFTECPYNHCIMDLDGKRFKEADMAIFFIRSLGRKSPPLRPPGQLWVKAMWESPVHYNYPKNYAPWKSAFNLTYNYRIDSDIFAPNNQLGWRHKDLLLSDAEYLQIAHQKKKAVAWFVSNCRTNGRREQYVQELKKYIPVDIYGKCGPKKCDKLKPEECENLLTSTYFFYLSFENSICKDYLTEKFLERFNTRTHIIPVVRGGSDYDKYFPPGGFINTKHFPKARDLGLFLKELMNDEKRYARMLREQDRLKTLDYKVDFCEVCEKLHTNGYPPSRPTDSPSRASHLRLTHGPPRNLGHSCFNITDTGDFPACIFNSFFLLSSVTSE